MTVQGVIALRVDQDIGRRYEVKKVLQVVKKIPQ